MARRRPTEPTANPARGAILVVAAVLLGIFLLRHGLDTKVDITGTPKSSTDGGTAGATTSGTSSTSSTLAVRSPDQVPTIVLNGTKTAGAARKYSTALATAGYHLTNPNGDTATSQVETTTKVLYSVGFQKEADAVAAVIGAPQTAVGPVGSTLPGTTANASVIVVLGSDLAAKTPPSVVTTTTV
jgi:hypothetical protein